MPVTPFHFGPGALLHSVAPRHVSFVAFCAANVLIDLESLYNLVYHRNPVHAFFHTYIGATLVVAGTIALLVAMLRLGSLLRIPNWWGWKELSLRQLVMGAALGAYSHVALDSVMHQDIRPLAPLSQENSLQGLVSLGALDWICVATGVVGLIVLGIRKVLADE